MRKLVPESLEESVQVNEAKKIKSKSNPEDAVKGLKDQLAKAKKPGAFKTTIEKNAKIKELEEKIKKFEARAKK
jgi:hypothetical protein